MNLGDSLLVPDVQVPEDILSVEVFRGSPSVTCDKDNLE